MAEDTSLEFRLRKIDETRNYLLEEVKHIDLISEKYKKTRKYLNYAEHLLILVIYKKRKRSMVKYYC